MRKNDENPVLFWDFHGTLTKPDVVWFDVAMEAAAELAPHRPLTAETLNANLSRNCLPWFTIPDRDARHLTAPGAWWAHSEAEFEKMFQRCGFTHAEAETLAPALREKVLQPARYQLFGDAVLTLKTLKARGYKSYILSNNFPELPEIVTALGLDSLFEQVLVSARIGYDKPRPEIFAHARVAAGQPQNPWMIGDNPVDDIAGGAAAGFTTVAVHGASAPEADHAIDELSELLALLT
ncbi:HAD family hydrolase [Ruminococcaceae bacterium OttesenSCG-928-D13]|nr:HAD family hydrolase [Ruminococcaceae bacterium OttesenSCG-928-D13]